MRYSQQRYANGYTAEQCLYKCCFFFFFLLFFFCVFFFVVIVICCVHHAAFHVVPRPQDIRSMLQKSKLIIPWQSTHILNLLSPVCGSPVDCADHLVSVQRTFLSQCTEVCMLIWAFTVCIFSVLQLM